MKFLIKTKQIVLNQTWLVIEVLVSFVWGAEEVWQSLLSGCWLWYPPAGSFSFSQHVHNRLWTIFVLIWEQKAFLSDFPPLVLSSACIYFPGPSFMVGCAALETPKPMCVVLGKSCSHEFFPKYCQELLGRQIIPLREVRHHSFFFPNAFVIQRCSCLTSGLCVYLPLKAERCVWVVEVYVQVCLVLCHLDRVTDTQG